MVDARIRNLLIHAQTSLMEAGVDDAQLSAQILLAHVLRVERTKLLIHDDALVSDELCVRFWALVESRKASTPIAYLTQEKEFFSLPFYVDARVLIPRPETELLVEEAMRTFDADPTQFHTLCDVGSGSGIIPIVLKSKYPRISVTGVDRSQDALDVARKNADRHGVLVRWVLGDLLANIEGPLDMVTANLPYIPTQDLKDLDEGVRSFEPRSALDGGRDGLELILRLIEEAQKKMRPEGVLLLEFGMGQSPSIEKALQAAGFIVECVLSDYASIPRILRARKR